jgi:hypothetical protein
LLAAEMPRMIGKEFVAGTMIAAVPVWLGEIERAINRYHKTVRDTPRRKVRTPKGAVVGNTHRQSTRYVAPIGTVQQRIDRLE